MTKSRSKKRKRRFSMWLYTDFVLSAIFDFLEDQKPITKAFRPRVVLRKNKSV